MFHAMLSPYVIVWIDQSTKHVRTKRTSAFLTLSHAPLLTEGAFIHTRIYGYPNYYVLCERWVPTPRVLPINGRHSTVEVQTRSAGLSIHTVNHMVEPHTSFTALIGCVRLQI